MSKRQNFDLSGTFKIPAPTDGPIGQILLEKGILDKTDIEAVLRYQQEHSVRFGQAAAALGLVDSPTLNRALSEQFNFYYLIDGQTRVSRDVVVAYQPESEQAEMFRRLRTELSLRWFMHPEGSQTLAIISPDHGDGRSYVSANLAVAYAQMGMKTLLIDGDMRNPHQQTMFGIRDQYGLSSYLNNRDVGAAFHTIEGLENLTILPVGGTPPNPQELLFRALLAKLITTTSNLHDVVIIDTPAANYYSDAQILMAQAKGALMVSRRNVSRVNEERNLIGQCRVAGASVVGAVLLDEHRS